MTDLLALAVLCGLVTWRVSSLLHTESAFEWLRRWIKIGNDEQGYPAIYPDTALGKVFKCFWCLSLLVAMPIAAFGVTRTGGDPVLILPVWLASGTIAIWTEKQIMHSQSR